MSAPSLCNRNVVAEDDTMPAPSPFHEGEKHIQTALRVREEIEPWARRMVRPFLPDEHRDFYSQLPFIVLAARDAAGRPWATLLAEGPGFVSSPDPRTLHVAAMPPSGDALAGALNSGDDIGLLGIELHTRRRNRVNGELKGRGSEDFVLSVEQSFGNCPQYITERSWRRVPSGGSRARVTRAPRLSREQQDLIGRPNAAKQDTRDARPSLRSFQCHLLYES